MCVRNLGRLEQLALGVVQRIVARDQTKRNERGHLRSAPRPSNQGEPLGCRSFRFRPRKVSEQNLAQNRVILPFRMLSCQ